MTLTFQDFRDGMGGDVCRRIGVDLSGLTTWAAYTRAMLDHDGSTRGRLVEDATAFGGVASSGERVVLAAALAACDHATQADMICPGFWSRVDRLGDEARTAIAAAIARQDAGHG